MQTALAKVTSWRFMVRQFALRETLENLSADVRHDFAAQRAKLEDPNDQARMERVTDAVTSLRRLDALRFLHWTLKSWLLPHVVATSLMLALLVVHIFQVVYGVR